MQRLQKGLYWLTSWTRLYAYTRMTVTTSQTIGIGVVIATFCIVGISLNVLTMVVIATTEELKTEFMRLIFFLCVSDLLSAIISPFVWYRDTLGFNEYVLPEGICKLTWGVDVMTSEATALMITSLAIYRYIAIQFPIKYRVIKSLYIRISLLLVWVCATCVGFIPMMVLQKVEDKKQIDDYYTGYNLPVCSMDVEKLDVFVTYMTYSMPIFVCLPTVLVLVFSALIIVTVSFNKKAVILHGGHRSSNMIKRQIRVTQQLSFIVLGFLIGYVPITVYSFWAVTDYMNTSTDYWFYMTAFLCTRVSASLNPVFYNFSSEKMRKHTKAYVAKISNVLCKRRGRATFGKRNSDNKTVNNRSSSFVKITVTISPDVMKCLIHFRQIRHKVSFANYGYGHHNQSIVCALQSKSIYDSPVPNIKEFVLFLNKLQKSEQLCV